MTQELDDIVKKKRREIHEEYLKAKKKASRLTQEERKELARKALQAAVKHGGKKSKK